MGILYKMWIIKDTLQPKICCLLPFFLPLFLHSSQRNNSTNSIRVSYDIVHDLGDSYLAGSPLVTWNKFKLSMKYRIMHELPCITIFWSRVRRFANNIHE